MMRVSSKMAPNGLVPLQQLTRLENTFDYDLDNNGLITGESTKQLAQMTQY